VTAARTRAPALRLPAGWPRVALVLGAGLLGWALLGTFRAVEVVVGVLDAVFLAYFVRHTAFVASALRHVVPRVPGRMEPDAVRVRSALPPAKAGGPVPAAREASDAELPALSVLVSCKNERFVVDGLVSALLALDYPADRLQLVVVDDGSDDGTGEILDARAAVEPRLLALHRVPGQGRVGKSAGLNFALPRLSGEVVVVFDADHLPHADALRRLAAHFADPSVGAVQGRCRIRNAADSPLARLITIDYLAGYLVNEFGRQSVFGLPAYGGANCAIRLEALRALGGWNEKSVTEDTDVTMRLMLSGRRVRYEPAAVDDEEGVISVARYWRQRYRWARGHQQVCRDYLRHVWRAPHLSPAERMETLMFLFVFHVPLATLSALALLLLTFAGVVPSVSVPGGFVLWTLLFLGPMLELGGGLLLSGIRRRDVFAIVWFMPLFLISSALCTKAWIDGLAGTAYDWVRTDRAAAPEGGAGS
jgi:1,2-diacylglycerol 3-beta-glucosyltransferase